MAKSDKHKNQKDTGSEEGQENPQQEFQFEPSSGKTGRVTWVFMIGLLLASAIAAGIYWNQSLEVEKIALHGHALADTGEIKHQAKFAIGQKRDSLNMLHVIDKVEQVDYVRNAEVSVDLYGTLAIKIHEREPLALLADNETKMWVDKDGVVLPMRLGTDINIPLLYGFQGVSPGDTLKSDAFKSVSKFLTKARTHPFTWSTLSEIVHHPVKGVMAISDEQGVRLIFGNRNFTRKMQYWKAFYGQVMKHKKLGDQREIDLRYEGQIVTR